MYMSITDIVRWWRGDSYKKFSKFDVFCDWIYYLFSGSFIFDIELCFKKIRWFFQRAKRGWAECDMWGMYCYLGKVISGMLKELKENEVGYPAGMTEEEWDQKMRDMIRGFELVADSDNDFINVDDTVGSMRMWMEHKYGGEIENDRILRKSLKLFAENYLNLLD